MANKQKKALVLSGGGITGIAWELGILKGLEDEGISLDDVDLIIGTSAGSSVGAQITSGLSLEELYNLQMVPIEETPEKSVHFDATKFQQMMGQAVISSPDAQTARAKIGKSALEANTMSEDERLKVMASRLPSTEWNENHNLIITAVDAKNGEFVTFDRESGVPLLLAVAASSAVPGIYPPTTINDRRYIDGGMASGTNADLAQYYDIVLVLVAEPAMKVSYKGPTMHRISFEDEIVTLVNFGSEVMVISPDEQAIVDKGMNPLDPSKRSVSAQAGRRQGKEIAEKIKNFWFKIGTN